MVWPPVEFGVELADGFRQLSRSLMVIPGAAPRSAWMGGFLSLTGKSSVAKAGEVLGCGPSLLSLYTSSWNGTLLCSAVVEAECGFSRLALASAHKHVWVLFWPCRADHWYRLVVGSDVHFNSVPFKVVLQGTYFSILVANVMLGFSLVAGWHTEVCLPGLPGQPLHVGRAELLSGLAWSSS